ncbi:MAG TPA: hypothetical protein ENI23_04515 [bacterium]|nr:hypothetical protein [bacterium]
MDTKTLYIGFVREKEDLITSFITDDLESAKKLAARHVDDALPNNAVLVYKISLDIFSIKPIITAVWTPEGEEVTVHDWTPTIRTHTLTRN